MTESLASIPTGELVEMAVAVASELAGRDGPDSGSAALEQAEALGCCLDLVEAALAARVRRVDAGGAHRDLGFSSVASWLRERLGSRHGRATERVELARQLPRLHRTGKLLIGGGLPVGFATEIAGAVTRLDDADAESAEEILLGMVTDGCGVRHVARAADRITDLIHQRQGTEPEPEDGRRGFAGSWLRRSTSLDGGSWWKGRLTPEHAAAFDAIVGPLAKPRAQGDDRDIAQRTADAMMSVLTEGNKGAGVTIVIDLETYTQATADPGPYAPAAEARRPPHDHRLQTRYPTAPAPASSIPAPTGRPGHSQRPEVPIAPSAAGTNTEIHVTGVDESPLRPELDGGSVPWKGTAYSGTTGTGTGTDRPETGPVHSTGAGPEPTPSITRSRFGIAGAPPTAARLLDGTPISPQDARRIALQAGINALLLGRGGQPLDLGRTVRFATPAQRKVLLAMYETCCVKGCPIPAHLCEIHHLGGGWSLGTPTDLRNLAPACGAHNRFIDHHGHQITQTRDHHGRAVITIHPPWTTTPKTQPSARPYRYASTGPFRPEPPARQEGRRPN